MTGVHGQAVVLKVEPVRLFYVPVNLTIPINLFRQHGFASMTQALRQLAHDVHRLFSFFQ
ncbi:hypothetical protein H6F89_26410 [Cyanobacteria bacterium FACHB-63]|nr:hypothetical protein [Cyanobacteria bacterium FACHB-63]